MAFCNKCGTEIIGDSSFCHTCGSPVVAGDTGGGSAPVSDQTSDGFKTQLRQKPVYGVVNLENLPEGHVVDARYEIKQKIGQGGFGAVYRVFDRKMKIEKALKVLPEAVVSDREAMVNIEKEATTMARLNHPNIVRVYDFQDQGPIKYIDMEYVDGTNLTDIKLDAPGKKLAENQVKAFGKQIAKGLAYAHDEKVIHRDIKPQNILVSQKRGVKIMDFGISETVRNSMSRMANSSSSGTLVYMSPEQLKGKDVGNEADIYSFGVLLYELVSGKTPFNKGDIAYQIINEKPERILGISDGLNDFLQKCLAKDYKNRYRNFGEVQKALDWKAPDTQKPHVDEIPNNEAKPGNPAPSPEISIVDSHIDPQKPAKRKKAKHWIWVLALFLLLISNVPLKMVLETIYQMGIPGLSSFIKPENKDIQGKLLLKSSGITGKVVNNSKIGDIFLICGQVQNNYPETRHSISLVGKLFGDGGKVVQSKVFYAGNVINEADLVNMDEDMIMKRIQNNRGDNGINSNVRPGQMIPFMVVFTKLDENLTEFSVEMNGSVTGSAK